MKILPAFRRIAPVALAAAVALALASPAHARQFAVGELVDPATGARWVLLRDTEHPEAPGRWVLARAGEADAAFARSEPPVIHAGDKILLVEHTAIADARLAAFALTSAAKGDTLRARVAIGGGVVTARAAGKGLAELDSPEPGPAKAGWESFQLEARP